MIRFDRIFAIVSLTIMTAGLSLLGYWWFFDQTKPPIEVVTGTSTTNKVAYLPGEMMIVHRRSCWNSLRPYATHRAFVDHIVFNLTDFQSAQPSLGCNDVQLAVQIPPELPPGEYLYRVWLDFDINPIRSMRVVLPDIALTVLPPKE